MGEISDMIVHGQMCSDCGICFVEAHGYPVVCKSCAEAYSKRELVEDGLHVARYKEIGENIS